MIAGSTGADRNRKTEPAETQLPAWMQRDLTLAQRKPLSRTKRHACIFAAAGSGKTRTLAHYIAYDIALGTPPDQIVAFTFTERAASELRARVEGLIHLHLGSIETTGLYVGTIHAWALQYLLNQPEYYNIEAIDELQVDSLVSRLYDNFGLKQTYGLEFPRAIGKFVKDLEIYYNESLTIPDVPVTVRDAIGIFEETAHGNRLIPFGAMITRASDLMVKAGPPPISRLYCDEYQDVNPAQVRLMQSMLGEQTRVVVVGDDLQSIYQWRGSDVGRILMFANDFPDSEVFPLTQNFRSRPVIVRAANRIGETVSVRAPKEMQATRLEPTGPSVLWLSAIGREEEATLVAQLVELLIAGGVPANKIAVLLRSVVRRGREIADAFQQRKIPFESPILGRSGGFVESFLIPIFQWLCGEQRPPRNEEEETAQFARMNALWDSALPWLPTETDSRSRFWEGLADWRLRIDRSDSSTYDVRGRLYDFMDSTDLRIRPSDHDIMAGLGIGSQIIRSVEEIHRRRLGELPRRRPSRVMREVLYALIRESPKFGQTAPVAPSSDAVLITTVHQAKGLEWPVVVLPALDQNFFPHAAEAHGSSYPDSVAERYGTSLDDETRLFYVAITRARERLFLVDSCATRPHRRSSFLTTLERDGIASLESLASLPPTSWQLSRDDLYESDQVPLQTGLSDLLLAAECPYEYGLRSRAQIQPSVSDELGYGKGLHEIIQRRFDHGDEWTSQDRRSQVDANVHLALMSAAQEARARDQIDRRIAKLEALHAFVGDLDAEVEVEVRLPSGYIRGVVDGVLHEPDGSVVIRDWKTNIHAELLPRYVRQLQFYAYALQLRGQVVARSELIDVGKTLSEDHLSAVDVAIGPAALSRMINELDNSLQGVAAGQFSPTPSRGVCGACDMRRICGVRWST